RYGYTRWDGTQRIEGLDADDVLNALADDYVEGGNLEQALRRLMQEGVRSEDGRRTLGLRELMERMRNQRQQQLKRYNMASGVMDDLREKLEEIKRLERAGIQRRLEDRSQDQSSQVGESGDDLTPEQKRRMLEMIAKRKQDFLDQLPDDVPGQIKQLTD